MISVTDICLLRSTVCLKNLYGERILKIGPHLPKLLTKTSVWTQCSAVLYTIFKKNVTFYFYGQMLADLVNFSTYNITAYLLATSNQGWVTVQNTRH